MSQQVSTTYYIFDIPVKKTHSNLTVQELNTNLEFLANKLCYALGMEIFTSLTEESETYGKAFYIGFNGASHASLCIYSPWRTFSSGDHVYCLEFVDENNNPISSQTKFQRNENNISGFQLDNNANNSWCIAVTENNKYLYLEFFSSTNETLATNIVDVAYRNFTFIVSNGTNNRVCPWMLINKDTSKEYYGHWSGDCFYFINTPINKYGYDYVYFGKYLLNGTIKTFFDINKKYIIDNDLTFYNNNVDPELIYPWSPGSDFRSLAVYNVQTNFKPRHGSIGKIDDYYYLMLMKYGGTSDPHRAPLVLKMGDTYNVQTVDLR